MNIQNELVEYIDTMNESNIEHKYRNTNLLNVAKKIYQLEINEVKIFECKKFTIKKYYVELKNGKKRSYLVKIAKDSNLPSYARPDSQGICFIGQVNIKDFLTILFNLILSE
jgi:tRNA U34 2-thiouridine synthase MnmA/TrmU